MADGAGRRGWIALTAAILLASVHFLLRPWLLAWPVSPDLLAGGLFVGSLRLRGGPVAALGFVLGGMEAAMALEGLGGLALAYALAGYLAVRARELFFGDARLFVFLGMTVGVWVLILANAGFTGHEMTLFRAALEAPLEALLTTALCAPVALIVGMEGG